MCRVGGQSDIKQEAIISPPQWHGHIICGAYSNSKFRRKINNKIRIIGDTSSPPIVGTIRLIGLKGGSVIRIAFAINSQIKILIIALIRRSKDVMYIPARFNPTYI